LVDLDVSNPQMSKKCPSTSPVVEETHLIIRDGEDHMTTTCNSGRKTINKEEKTTKTGKIEQLIINKTTDYVWDPELQFLVQPINPFQPSFTVASRKTLL